MQLLLRYELCNQLTESCKLIVQHTDVINNNIDRQKPRQQFCYSYSSYQLHRRKQVMFFTSVYFFLSDRLLKKIRMDFDKFSGGVGHDPRNNRLDFGGGPDNNPDPVFSVYYRDCYRQPRIKHENSRQRFELSERFLVQHQTYPTYTDTHADNIKMITLKRHGKPLYVFIH